MNDPDAKDYNWLIARERGEDIGHVLAGERAPYERLGALLRSGTAPRAGFRQRVLDAIDAAERAANPAPEPAPVAPAAEPAEPAEPAAPAVAAPEPARVVPLKPKTKPSRKRLVWLAGGLAAAAAGVLVVTRIGGPEPGPDRSIVLVAERRDGGAVVRAGSAEAQANVGDTLVLRAEATGPAELRVYGGTGARLLATCSDRGGCTIERDGERRKLVLELPLAVPGTVHAVVFVGESLPASSGAYAQDVDAAAGARIRYQELAPPMRVR